MEICYKKFFNKKGLNFKAKCKLCEYIKHPLSDFNTRLFFILLCLFFYGYIPAYSYEDCIVTTNGKMSNIKIQDNSIIDVFPLITIMNDKNTLIVHPLKTGKTKFSFIKNEKEKFIFDVNVTNNSTTIDNQDGFEILNIDCPPGSFIYYFDIDSPPSVEDDTEFLKNIDMPPALRSKEQNEEFPPELRGMN